MSQQATPKKFFRISSVVLFYTFSTAISLSTTSRYASLKNQHNFLPHDDIATASSSLRRSCPATSLRAERSSDNEGSAGTKSAKIGGRVKEEEDARAGRAGYSRLRQPASMANWDPGVDASATIPLLLDETKESPEQIDTDWWSNKDQKQQQQQQDSKKARRSSQTSLETRKSVATSSVNSEEDLNLFERTLETLDYPRVLEALEDECTTVPGRNIVKEAVKSLSAAVPRTKNKNKLSKRKQLACQPLTADSVDGAKERYQAVREMDWLLQGGTYLEDNDSTFVNIEKSGYFFRDPRNGYKEPLVGKPPPLRGNTFDLDDILKIADNGRVLEGPDIFEVSNMLNAFEKIVAWGTGLQKIEELQFVEIPRLVEGIQINETLLELLDTAFDKDGRLSGQTFPTIGRLRSEVRLKKQTIMATLDEILAMPSMQSKITLESGGPLYSQVSGGRLVVPVEPKYASSIGMVHDTSRSGKTVFVEPSELISPTNELRQTEGELRAEEARVWRSLTQQILLNREWLEMSVQAAGQLDLVLSRLMLGRKWLGNIPEVRDEGVISLRNAKHPVLLIRQEMDRDSVVGSDVNLGAIDGNQGLVLTGPNAGGKTVILKLLGLYALMARSGIPVPADSSTPDDNNGQTTSEYCQRPRIDFFDPVLADIGDLQSVGSDLSTFSGHMLVCRQVLASSGRNALVLMDELGSGTDPAQGVAIAQALLEALVDTGARVAITTHYMELKQLAASDSRFAVAGMQFVNGSPTYKLLPGTVGESYALAVAERLQLPKEVITRATELLDSETRQMGDLILELEDQKALADLQAKEMEEKRKELAALEVKMKEEQIRLEKKQLVARRDEAKKFAQKLEEKERVLEDILEKLKSDPSRRIIAKSWDDVRFVKRDALNEAENVPSVMALKRKAAVAMEEAQAQLVPLAELRDKPALKLGDKLIVCKPGPLFGREGTVVKALVNKVEIKVNNMSMTLKLNQVAMPSSSSTTLSSSGSKPVGVGKKSTSKAAEKAIKAEKRQASLQGDDDWSSVTSQAVTGGGKKSSSASSGNMRTQVNTVDVRGCNLEEAKEMSKDKFSTCLMAGRPVVYILHGHGTKGILKTKIRSWLKSERQLVKKWGPADASDGGDAFTRVELK